MFSTYLRVMYDLHPIAYIHIGTRPKALACEVVLTATLSLSARARLWLTAGYLLYQTAERLMWPINHTIYVCRAAVGSASVVCGARAREAVVWLRVGAGLGGQNITFCII